QHRELLERAARSLGVFTEADLADWWRMPSALVKPRLRELEAAGIVEPVTVEGWHSATGRATPAWRHRDATAPRRFETETVLSPFDPIVWYRPRAERLFHFTYRIEIYTPAPQRQFGYYSLPVLVDDAIVARVDLKADRPNRTLLVQSTWAEQHAPGDLGERLLPALREAAAWRGLERVEVRPVGNAAHRLPNRFEVG
ncbi:MAG TPA: crosslink repair DNA glycosylase YcaQ family protein, partial [Microbacteriaceae bacterium]|nr:crosslink repair DNA glycosylase YcaQ family protein [Microbacteriaceae bacterium]